MNDKFLFNSDDKQDLDGFVQTADDHTVKEWFKSAKKGTIIWAGGIAVLSALFTFLFGMVWIHPIFIDFFYLWPLNLLPDGIKLTGAQIAAGAFMVMIYDGAAMVSLRSLIFGAAQTRTQQDLLTRHFWITFGGSFVASVSYAILSLNGSLISYNATGEQAIGWIIVTVSLLTFVFDLVTAAKFYQASPEVLKARFLAEQREKALERQQDRDRQEAELKQRMRDEAFLLEQHIAQTALDKTMEKAGAHADQISSNMAKAAAKRFTERHGLTPQDPQLSLPQQAPAPMAMTSPTNDTITMIDTATGEIVPPSEGDSEPKNIANIAKEFLNRQHAQNEMIQSMIEGDEQTAVNFPQPPQS